MNHYKETSERTVYVQNLSKEVTEGILEELFSQVGSVEKVIIKFADKYNYAFIEFTEPESVLFAIEMLDEIALFGTKISINPRENTQQAEKYKQLRTILQANRSLNFYKPLENESNHNHSNKQKSKNYNINNANKTNDDSINQIPSLMKLPPPPTPPNLFEKFNKNINEIILRNNMQLALNDLSKQNNFNREKNYRNNSQNNRRSFPYDKYPNSSTFLSNKYNKNKFKKS